MCRIGAWLFANSGLEQWECALHITARSEKQTQGFVHGKNSGVRSVELCKQCFCSYGIAAILCRHRSLEIAFHAVVG